MKYKKLSDVCSFRKGKVCVCDLSSKTYISTENMLPNKRGIIDANKLPNTEYTQEYRTGDILISNIRPYFKKIWYATQNGGCSSDVLVLTANDNIVSEFLYYILADDSFFFYSMATSKGTKMPRGDKDAIMKYNIPNFDKIEQLKIATLLRNLDYKIELNNNINNNLAA